MKERPILFTGPMVRALRDGRKTQTRRLVKPFPVEYDGMWMWKKGIAWGAVTNPAKPEEFCPYGVSGDSLWVKETFRWHLCCGCKNEQIHFAADGPACPTDGTTIKPWRSPLFMRRTYSRITLGITGVRVERLHDISKQDAEAEGVESAFVGGNKAPVWRDYAQAKCDPFEWFSSPVDSYRSLWEKINGKKPGARWADNPWVWVIEFRRVES